MPEPVLELIRIFKAYPGVQALCDVNLAVAANVFFGREQLSFGPFHLIDTAAMVARTKPLLERLGADFEPDTPVAALSLAQRQLVEIAKALSPGAEIVIMDEPTSSLTLTETNRLL